ncbi:MAG: 3-isopropylmalate dehydrogenase [Pseudomonadota bacterium]|nr:3-isopropylmalate dehydrogenase [Pseudomonadota bacterium]
MTHQLLLLPGDGIGPEIIREAERVIQTLTRTHGLSVELERGLIGGAAYEAEGDPLPERTLALAKAADAVLFGAVGGPQWDTIARDKRPERGLLRIRAGLDLFANLRPATLAPELAEASSLRPELVAGLDIMIVRELTGGIYFGQPREQAADRAYNTMVYSRAEVERIARRAFEIARLRGRRLCSVDKANVLEVSEFWRETVTAVAADYPDVELSHMYVDNAAMQLVRAPKQFDVIVTGNLFGDVLSDIAAMLTGSIGMLPSASLNEQSRGLYEPVHGSAPDIAGQDKANPLATILSLAMLLRYSLGETTMAEAVEAAVGQVLADGLRTADLHQPGTTPVGTAAMGDAVIRALEKTAH